MKKNKKRAVGKLARSTKRKNKEQIKKTTIDWIDIDTVEENHIVLKGKEHLIGVKLDPKNIFIEESHEQMNMVYKLRQVFSSNTKYPLYHPFVSRPINLDNHILPLQEKMLKEESQSVRDLYQDEINLWQIYQQQNKELEFFICIKGKPTKQFDDYFSELCNSLAHAGFTFSILNKIDYEALLAATFENPILNEFYFSRGLLFDETVIEKLEKKEGVEDETI